MTTSTPLSRRRFLAASLAAPFILTAPTWGRARRIAASERITVGLIGCGGMGNANLWNFIRKPEVQILAVCDPDRARRLASKKTVEEFYGSQSGSEYHGCDDFNDFRDLLARADIDAVIVASPDHWHAAQTVLAARAGKDIYGEKPLSHTIGQGRAMSDAVRRYGRIFQTGSQQRSDARFRKACELIRNGRLGRVHRITCGLPGGEVTGNHPPIPVPEGFDYDLWLGPAPYAPYCEQRTHYNFRHILDYSGGKLTDWGAHHLDIAQWALGTMNSGPHRIRAAGTYPADGLWNAPVTYRIECEYDTGALLIATSDAENGVLFEGEHGRLFVSRSRIEAQPASILNETIAAHEDRLFVSDDHTQNFLDCVRTRREPVAPIEHAHRSIAIAHLGNIAMQVGRELRWNPLTEEILNDPTASAMLDRTPRAPWLL